MQDYRIVVVDDEPANLESLERILKSDGGKVTLFQDPEEALRFVQRGSVDVLLTDLRMRFLNGIELLESVKKADPTVEVILLTAFGTVELAVEAMRKGAYDFITKPLQRLQVIRTVHRALEKRRLVTENLSLREELHATGVGGEVLGRSESLVRLMGLVNQAARSRANVLIHGESGTGKGLIAEYIHRGGQGLFVKVNCAAIPENLLEAELFGYEPGAFTGAVKRKKGRVELANGGTLFLDEIGIAPLTFQAKLLRFLQEGEFERLGSNETLRVETRVIAATNLDLPVAIKAGIFREDLYYRLNVVNLRVPPLRERKEDIPLLAQKFLEDSAKKNQRAVPMLHPEALAILVEYAWPGNIRELQNLMERVVVLGRSGMVEAADLPTEFGGSADLRTVTIPLGLSLRQVEKLLMEEVLRASHGDKKQAAKLLGVHPRTIHRFLESTEPVRPGEALPEGLPEETTPPVAEDF
ncbi:sigma-54 dependent transcriptional regulator [bacterium]|nr:sigma-54 dependent transcriptional regulator [bacterium]